jgi:hypothetical protein
MRGRAGFDSLAENKFLAALACARGTCSHLFHTVPYIPLYVQATAITLTRTSKQSLLCLVIGAPSLESGVDIEAQNLH